MTRTEHLAQGLLKPMNPHGAALLGYLTFLWGVWVIIPFWNVFNSAEVFEKTAEFAPEWAWGLWATVCGLTIIVSVLRSSAPALARSACFSLWHWATVSGMMWWGDWQNTAGLTYMFVAAYALFVFLNIRVNYVKQGIRKF